MSTGPGSASRDGAGPGSTGPADPGPLSRVEPGTGWPGDPATARTPVARSAADVRKLAATAGDLDELAARESVCRACPRLVAWREQVATARRRSFASERYWGRPIPGWGPAQAGVAIVGLAPAAHGGNRTGRIFTGDRSGDVLFASLYRCGLAARPESVTAGDGQRLIGARMLAAVRCAPPQNKPTPQERDTCAPWLVAELALMLPALRVVVCLGAFAWQAVWSPLAAAGFAVPRPRPAFAHGAEVVLERQQAGQHPGQHSGQHPGQQAGQHPGQQDSPAGVRLIGCYHPSQQNTFTGRVTPAMLDDVFSRARELARA
jgi:uracil-DNA glycosylase family 4